MTISHVFTVIFVTLGLIFLATGVLGVIKFPGFNTRLHASGVGETLGAMLIVAGLMVMSGFRLLTIKIAIVFFILMLTNPLGGNLIMMEAVHATNYHNYNKKKHGKKIEDKTDAEAELKSLRESEMMESEIFIDKLNVWEGRK